ncbi:MAG TPA: hypothetical protein QF424_00730 [Candidatus Thalassarchaeaceae archaeon]|nr:hypothetical protein [Candidatus Thalassarchaeaceae archaeon]
MIGSLPPTSDDHWEPSWYHAMAVVLLVCAYLAGWLDVLWQF